MSTTAISYDPISNQTPSMVVAVPSSSNPTVDLDSIPNQVGHAVLRANDGTIIQPPTGSLSETDLYIVYKMMLEIGVLLKPREEHLKRVTVGFKQVTYAVAMDNDGFLYVVKKRSTS